jgi:signal transduction histidine kinase
MQYPLLQEARFLIVDDEVSNVRLLERVLEFGGAFQVESTTDARLALRLFLEGKPDMVLLDLHMPHVDGLALMAQFREAIPAGEFLPILVLSADITSETKLRALEGGAHDFLTKPFDHLEVLARIQNLLENRFLHRELRRQNEVLEGLVRERTVELERTLERLKAAQELVVKQERLRALGMMASGIAHDFNNALTMVLGYAELMAPYVRASAPERQRQNFENLMTSAQDAVHVVGRLREFYRPSMQDEVRVPVDVNLMVDQTLTLTAPRWRDTCRSLGVYNEVEADLQPIPTLLSTASEVREILTNLIFNAVDAMPSGGKIRVSTREVSGRIELQVEDSGVGMSEEEKARCLEPFYTTKGEGGTGLGLAVVFGFVQRHGGSISIRSALSEGTCVTLLLPGSKLALEPVGADPEPLPGRLRILVVDDQETIGELVAEMIRAEGHLAESVVDGRKAIEVLGTGTWDVVISDQSMPAMSGTELAEEIRARGWRVPFLLLTGFGEEMKAQGGSPPGVDLIVSKPLTRMGLREALHLTFDSSFSATTGKGR